MGVNVNVSVASSLVPDPFPFPSPTVGLSRLVDRLALASSPIALARRRRLRALAVAMMNECAREWMDDVVSPSVARAPLPLFLSRTEPNEFVSRSTSSSRSRARRRLSTRARRSRPVAARSFPSVDRTRHSRTYSDIRCIHNVFVYEQENVRNRDFCDTNGPFMHACIRIDGSKARASH